ncbi:MAG: BON domain-containing protein [Paraburkholderia sp.]|jgi:hypothetical protein|nr:BON domain-containing protein [Paraburkholderia sp.]
MNKKGFLPICLAASIAALLGSVDVRAQGDATAVASTAPAASTPREVRKANRALSRKVYAALAKHKEIEAGSISVVARGGAVTLDGTVTNASQIETVVAVAKAVPGVKSVTSKLSVHRPMGQ